MDFSQARRNMVEGQLTPNKIISRPLIKRFLEVPREAFVDVANKNTAYIDNPIYINTKRQMFSPLTCAHMLQSLNLNKSDNVLVVASASGYTTSLLSGLVNNVYGVENDLSLLEMSRRALLDASCKSVSLHKGKPSEGLNNKALFDKIIIDVPVEIIPETLISQLTESGKIVAVVNDETGLSTLKLFTKKGNNLKSTPIREVTFLKTLEPFKKQKEFIL